MQDVAAEMLREARAQLAEQTIAHNLRVLGDEAGFVYELHVRHFRWCRCDDCYRAHLADRRVR